MKNRDDAIVRRIFKYCKEVDEALETFGDHIDVFKNTTVFRNAACMPIMQIGELCKLVSDDLRAKNSEIDWRGWCGIRDIIAHQYTNLDYDKTWDVIKWDLPKLKSQIEGLISDIDSNGISRIEIILKEKGEIDIEAKELYHEIVDNTGVSINAFTDSKILEYIKQKR